jgi:predicted DNA binding CopG/RHH family protein
MSQKTELNAVESDDAWEKGDLGRSEKHARRSSEDREQSVDAALELQMISIRLHKELIEQLKFIATFHGVGYQPLIRDILGRWCRTEILNIASQMQQQLKAKEAIEIAQKTA